MEEQQKERTEFINTACDYACKGSLVSCIVLPKDGQASKIKGTPKTIHGEKVIQFEYSLTEGRVRQENVKLSDLPSFLSTLTSGNIRRAELCGTDLQMTLLISKKGKSTLLRHRRDALRSDAKESVNDREKNYILTGGEDFLKMLDISDAGGRVHDKKQSKFRQINRFLEYVSDSMKYVVPQGTLHIADLCCGKSYLSFAVYYYLTALLGRTVEMTCIDMKKSVIEYCADTAEKLGYSGMRFLCDDVSMYEPEITPDIVISLHACDTATDIVLECAACSGAKVILSTPCCHHELTTLIDCEPLGFITKYSMLSQKLCTAATDALRCARLEAYGYSVLALELVDPEDTPKNILIAAHMKDNYDCKSSFYIEKREKYISYYKYITGKEPKPFKL